MIYLCFEEDDKRLVYPESALVSMDDNGITLHAPGQGRGGKDTVLLHIKSFQGCMQDFTKALTWIKKKPKKVTQELEFTNSAGVTMNETPAAARPAAQKAQSLPETPSF